MTTVAPTLPVSGDIFEEKVLAALEEIRPRLQKDNGDVTLERLEGNKIFVNLKGACVGCQLSNITLQGIQMKLIERLGFPVRVIPSDAPSWSMTA
ncbi:MAG: NifU family protein [Rhodospirillaceae bacterium]